MAEEVQVPPFVRQRAMANAVAGQRQGAVLLGSICDLDPEPIWRWGFIERVSTGLVDLRDFDGDDGHDVVEVAARSR